MSLGISSSVLPFNTLPVAFLFVLPDTFWLTNMTIKQNRIYKYFEIPHRY